MVNFAGRIEQIAVDVSMAMINAGVEIERVLIPVGEGISRAMHDIYSLDGFEKWTKAMIADLRFISLIPGIRGVFDECIKTLEAQKDLYYATLFIPSTAELFKKDPNSGEYKFVRPDKVKLLLLIGNYFDVGKFLQKYKVFPFSTCTYLSNTYGSLKIFNRRLDDIPVFGNVFERPKDLCVFAASGIEVWNCYQKGTLAWDNLLKFTSSLGKMLLITFGKHNSNTVWSVSYTHLTLPTNREV